MAYSWNNFGHFWGRSILTMTRRRLRAAKMADFSIDSPRPDCVAPHSKKSTKCGQNISPYGFLVIIPPSRSKSRITVTSGGHHKDSDTTMATNKGIFAFPNTTGRGQPFLRLYLPFCIGEGPVSSVFCRPGALIVSCLCTVNDPRDAVGSY